MGYSYAIIGLKKKKSWIGNHVSCALTMSHKFPTKKQYCMKQEFRVNRKILLRKGKELTSYNKRGFEGKTTRKLVYL